MPRDAATASDRRIAPGASNEWLTSAGTIALGCMSLAFALQSILSTESGALQFLSRSSWTNVVGFLGGEVVVEASQQAGQTFVSYAEVPFALPFITVFLFSALIVTVAKLTLRQHRLVSFGDGIKSMSHAWLWWLIPGLSELLQVLLFVSGFDAAAIILGGGTRYIVALSLAGWLCDLIRSAHTGDETRESNVDEDSRRVSRNVIAAMAVFVIVFTVMNWQLYRSLLVPHGDSAMYEEHLWNLLHGKGFRSYLDQGLFFGEHIQVVHLLLIPLYAIWPSHLLLESCETAALASGAIPIFWMVRRSSGSKRCAAMLATAYLLYPPLQFLDIAIDLKTFRPISFGVPAMLFAFDQFKRGRPKTMLLLFLLALSAKEDFALILGPFGLWVALQPFLQNRHVGRNDSSGGDRRKTIAFGLGIAAFSVAWLLLTTRVLIPWFRGGDEVHYARYFSKFGSSLGEIVINMFTQPGLLIEAFATAGTVSYLMGLLFPLAFLPLRAFSRFLVAVPILGLLCLNELIQGDPQPWHHFHAPVIPVLFWAAAGALGKTHAGHHAVAGGIRRIINAFNSRVPELVCALCLTSGLFVGLSPVGIRFWDPGSFFHWQDLYVPGERAKQFPKVLTLIPESSRVASTDFVHPRFTHFERSYDYSGYRRRVANYEDGVPDDTDFIVIDTGHYYSEIKTPDQVRELQVEPENWRLVDSDTNGLFIVLKRRRSTSGGD